MFWLELVLSLLVALCLSALLGLLFPRPTPRSGRFWFFLLIFLAAWAGGLWMRPLGPELLGVHWLPFVLVGVLAALVAILTQAERPPQSREETIAMLERLAKERHLKKAADLSVDLLLRLLAVALLALVLLRYLRG